MEGCNNCSWIEGQLYKKCRACYDAGAPRREFRVGEEIKLTAKAVVKRVSNSHGECMLVELPREDFSEPRQVWVNPTEVI